MAFKILSGLCGFLSFFLLSCGQGRSNQRTETGAKAAAALPVAFDNSLPIGKVVDTVVCKTTTNQSFALYLPSNYTNKEKHPVVFFFDSHAHGNLPVAKYKDIAEKYGFVLIGSNFSKNGTPWQVTSGAVKDLMEDVGARINIDGRRVYTSGFSGGSRVASSVAFLLGGVAGVIGCAAGIAGEGNGSSNRFDYFGIVGDCDFNLVDMEKLDGALGQNGFNHQLVVAHGKHAWADTVNFKTAVLWMQVNAMKENLQPKDEVIIEALKKDYLNMYHAAKSAGDIINTYNTLQGAISILGGLADVAGIKKDLDGLASSESYKKAVAENTNRIQTETQMQQELLQQFQTQDGAWWAAKIAGLNKSARSAKTVSEQQLYKRLLNYLGLVGYMGTNSALQHGDLVKASSYLKTFKLADPENPDVCYLSAVYYIKSNDTKNAMASLHQAIKLGYNDYAQLATDPVFATLQNDNDFKEILLTVKGK